MRLLSNILVAILCVPFCFSAPAGQAQDAAAKLLDHLAGNWVLQGTIAGKSTMHDIQAAWVLNREYLQLHEVSRERNEKGGAAYEAIVYLSWDAKAKQYSCLWLDSTAGGGLSAEGIAHGAKVDDSIPFIFSISSADQIHTTFSYDATSDSWRWLIDNFENGKTQRFADVRLKRAN